MLMKMILVIEEDTSESNFRNKLLENHKRSDTLMTSRQMSFERTRNICSLNQKGEAMKIFKF